MPPRRRRRDSLIEIRQLLDEGEILATLKKLCAAILAANPQPDQLVLIGIHSCGVPLASRLRKLIADASGRDVPVGTIDITLYRDDVFNGLARPDVGPTTVPCSLDGKVVVLVDDVLFTGRTIRSALVELMDFGRPAAVQLAVLIDRGHRELPIHADYVGVTLPTTREQSIRVTLSELGEPDRVMLFGRAST